MRIGDYFSVILEAAMFLCLVFGFIGFLAFTADRSTRLNTECQSYGYSHYKYRHSENFTGFHGCIDDDNGFVTWTNLEFIRGGQ